MMKKHWSIGVIFTVIIILNAPLAWGADGVLFFHDAVNEVIAVNPGLASLKARAQAMGDIPAQKGALPDPVLTAKAANLPLDTLSNTQENMTQMQVGISQKLPFLGKRSLRKQVAQFDFEAVDAEVRERQLQLVREVKVNWWNLFYLDRVLVTVQRNTALLRQFVNIAQTKYQVGKGLQQDVLLAQLELSKLLDAKLTFTNKRANAQTRLNALLDRPVGQNIILPENIDENLLKPLAQADLRARAATTRPLLMSLKKRLAAATARVALAKKDYYPDFMVGAIYGYRNGENPNGTERADFGSVAVSVTLPIYTSSRQTPALRQRKNEEISRSFALQDNIGRIEGQIVKARDDFDRFAEEVELYEKGIIPQAKQTVESMQAGYQVNKVDFLNLVRAQTALYNYETKYWRAMSRANQALAQLIASVGEENIYE